MPNNTEISEDIYAKVLDKTADPGNFYICFTSLTLEVEAQLRCIPVLQKNDQYT